MIQGLGVLINSRNAGKKWFHFHKCVSKYVVKGVPNKHVHILTNHKSLSIHSSPPLKSRQKSIAFKHSGKNGNQGMYLKTILVNVLGLVLKIFQYLKAFESNTTFNWLNHTV